MTIVQFTRFRVAAHRETALLETRQASLRACRGMQPELRNAYLIRLADHEWLDIAVWAGQPGAEAFDASLPASRPDFFGQIDELLGEECGILVHEEIGPAGGAGEDGSS
jgi:hypothetical protein